MIEIPVALLIVVCHFIGDFIFQSDNVAQRKSEDNSVLAFHVFTYSLPFLLLYLTDFNIVNTLLFLIWTYILHFVVDYFSSREAKRAYHQNNRRRFFIIIGLDQMLHYISLFMVYSIIWAK